MRSIKPWHVGGEWVGDIKALGVWVVSACGCGNDDR